MRLVRFYKSLRSRGVRPARKTLENQADDLEPGTLIIRNSRPSSQRLLLIFKHDYCQNQRRESSETARPEDEYTKLSSQSEAARSGSGTGRKEAVFFPAM